MWVLEYRPKYNPSTVTYFKKVMYLGNIPLSCEMCNEIEKAKKYRTKKEAVAEMKRLGKTDKYNAVKI